MTSSDHGLTRDSDYVKCPECRSLVRSLVDRAGHRMDCQRPYEEQRKGRG